jgi:hypothetical protein
MKDMAQSRTLIVIPAHNEMENLPHVFEGLREHAGDLDVVVIDDASTDETPAVAARLGAEVVRLPCNLGYGGAVQTGFKYALKKGYDFAVMMDADGQHDPADISPLLSPVIAGQADLAIGSRFLGVTDYQVGRVRRLGMRIFGAIVGHFTGRPVTDPTSGFQALNDRVLRFFARDNYPYDYPDADTLLLLHYAGFRVREVPAHMKARQVGDSMHHSTWRIFYYIFKMFLSIFIILLRQRTHGTPGKAAKAEEKAHEV